MQWEDWELRFRRGQADCTKAQAGFFSKKPGLYESFGCFQFEPSSSDRILWGPSLAPKVHTTPSTLHWPTLLLLWKPGFSQTLNSKEDGRQAILWRRFAWQFNFECMDFSLSLSLSLFKECKYSDMFTLGYPPRTRVLSKGELAQGVSLPLAQFQQCPHTSGLG
jgi:hypothetical protein